MKRARVALLAWIMSASAAHAQDRTQVIAADPSGRVNINADGPVTIIAWDRGEVAISASATNRAPEVKGGGALVNLVLRGAGSTEVKVPRAAQLRIEGGYGDVVISGLTGTIDAETAEGSVRIEGTARSVTANAFNGTITIIGGGSEITHAETVGGDIAVIRPPGVLNVRSVSGSILVQGTVREAELFNVSGKLRFEGTVEEKGRLSLESLSGFVEIVVPRTQSAAYDLTTVSGKLRTAFGPPVPRSSQGGAPFRFTVGSAAASIRGFNVSGPVTLFAK